MAEIHLSPDLEALSREAMRRFTAATGTAVAARGTAAVALAGGTTPRRLYELLATKAARDRVPWPGLRIFWTDERAVPPEDPRSNYRMARQALLTQVPVAPDRVHRMPADDPDLEAAAHAYAHLMAAHVPPGDGGWPRLDLILLGMGRDGHIASLFPGDPVLNEMTRAVAPVVAPVGSPHGEVERLTLTLPALNAAACIVFLVAGSDKAAAARRVLGEGDPRLPATRVQPARGDVIWLLDAAAASLLAPLTS